MNDRIFSHFKLQGDHCEKMGSPFTANLCRVIPAALDRHTATGRTILDWPGDPSADALALRFCGALHAIILDDADTELKACYPPGDNAGQLLPVLNRVITRHDARLAADLINAPQTNEIARAAALYPGLAEIARRTGLPLALHEIGASAGLNLMMDKFGYSFGQTRMGDDNSPARLAPEMLGASLQNMAVRVISRSGCDIAPLDINSPADRLRLRSYIWPDQPERMTRLDAAIGIASKTPFTLVSEDAADYVANSLAGRKRDRVFVLYHSVMWQYLPETTKSRIETAMTDAANTATRDAPLAWLKMEGLGGVEPHATLQLTLWPGGDVQNLAHCDWHCRWIEWLEK